jgi:hypothetical protein
VLIRPATEQDHDEVWRILEPTIRAGETYTLPRDMTRARARVLVQPRARGLRR